MLADRSVAVLALDVGGTAMKGAVVDEGLPLVRARFPTYREAGPDAVIAAIIGAVLDLATRAGELGLEVAAVGLAVPGVVDEVAGVARHSVNLGWCDVPMRRLVEDRVDVPVVLTHDVRAGGLAEALQGAAVGRSSALFVPIGTGIGAALIVRGQVLRGAHDQAGELGQVVVRPGVTLESIASAEAIARRYERAAGLPAGTSDARAVIHAASAGDTIAATVWHEALADLADVLATAIAVFDPAVVVVGGGLSRAGHALLDPLRARLAARLAWRSLPEVVPAHFADESGWVGAALLASRLVGVGR